MNTMIQRIINKLGPRFTDKAPVIAAIFIANPGLIPIALALGAGAAVLFRALDN